MSKEITLKLTTEQAAILNDACEMYMRTFMGQFDHIVFELMVMQPMNDKWCDRRDAAEDKMMEARQYIYPELHGRGHSYGIGRFREADIAYNIHQVVRHALGDERKAYDIYDIGMPKCEVKEVE